MEKTMNMFTKERMLQLKGMAILFMIFHHSFRDEDFFAGFHVNFAPFAVEDVILFSQVSKLCVAIFCFITGYGLYLTLQKTTKTGESLSVWIYNRLLKLIANYWFVFMICFLLILFLDEGKIWKRYFVTNGKTYGVFSIAADMLGLGAIFDTPLLNGAWWYISAAIVFTVIAPVMVSILNRFGTFSLLGMIVLLPRIFVREIDGENNIYRYMLIFAIGMVFAKSNYMNKILSYLPFKNRIITSKVCKLLVEILIFIVLYKAGNSLNPDRFWDIRYTLIPLIVIFMSLEFVAVIPYVNKLLGFLGIYSMDIFLLHNFFRNYFTEIMYQNKYFLVSSLLMLLFGTAAALLIHLLKRVFRYEKLIHRMTWQEKADI